MSDLHVTTEKPKSVDVVELRDLPPAGFVPNDRKDFQESLAATIVQPEQMANIRSVEHQIDSRLIVSANYETIARYKTDIAGTGAVVAFTDGSGDGPLQLQSGTSSTGHAAIWMNAGLNSVAFNLFDKSPWISTMIQVAAFAGSNVKNLYVVCGQVAPDLTSLGLKHFGFIVKNNSGTGELYITYANGTTQTKKQIKGFTLTDALYLHAKLVSGRYCEFYVNGVLVYTETNLQLLPSGASDNTYNRIWMSVICSTSGTTNMVAYQAPLTVGWKVG